MIDDAAGIPEFGTGLKAWLERSDQAHVRLETPSCRDLLLLYGDDVVTERQTTERVLVGGDLARRGAHGAAAA
jgi:hypothetical protein